MILEFLTWACVIVGFLIVAGWLLEGPVGRWLLEMNRRLHS